MRERNMGVFLSKVTSCMYKVLIATHKDRKEVDVAEVEADNGISQLADH